jgi:hypothetical protein
MGRFTMMKGCARLSIVGLLAIAACDTGSVSGPGGGGAAPDAADRNTSLGILCNATFKTSGTFAQGATKPADDPSTCWPVGTWTFSATLDTNDCKTPPALLPSYAFKVEQTTDANGDPLRTYTYTTDPTTHYHLKVSGDGGGLCEGGLELFSPDGKQYWNFKPSLETGNVIDGFGEYSLYDSDQWN